MTIGRTHPLGRAEYARIPLYAPPGSAAAVDLSDNTNRWGSPPAATRALGGAATARYPDAYTRDLKQAVAEYLDVAPDMVVTGCGSDDVLDCAIRAFGEPGGRLAYHDPTFVMVPSFARANGMVPVPVPLTRALDLDAGGMLATAPRIAYVCSPNNPTGTPLSRATVETLCAAQDMLVLVDEAYAEFADASLVDLATSRSNVLVVRTMSKAFGLAGLRVGYGVGAPALVREVEKARGPFKVTAPSAAAAVAALREDVSWMRAHAALAVGARQELSGELARRGVSVLPSSANFVLAPLARAVAVAARMRELGVAVRAFAALPRVTAELEATQGQALRITVGPPDEMTAALAALDRAVSECA